MTRAEIEERCQGCDACVDGVGSALPSLKTMICMESPYGLRAAGKDRRGRRQWTASARDHQGMYESIFRVGHCPRLMRGVVAKREEEEFGEVVFVESVPLDQEAPSMEEIVVGRFGALEL